MQRPKNRRRVKVENTAIALSGVWEIWRKPVSDGRVS